MSKPTVDIFAAAQNVGDGAPLKTAKAKAGETVARNDVIVRAKNIRNMPVDFFERHEALRKAGLTTLDFSAFIVEAVREKLGSTEKN